jgi:predicted nucleic acid-binding protein
MTEALFLDTDCLSTFLVVQSENIILQLYSGRIAIPQQVYEELRKVHFMKTKVETLLSTKRITLYQIEVGTEAATLYLKLTSSPDKGFRTIGSGEAAAIVLTRQHQGILGSNNLRDILPYVNLYNLQHRTSADIMVEAYEQHLITEGQGNVIWRDMINHNRKMPADTFSEFLSRIKYS